VKQVREPVEELEQLLQDSFYCYDESLELARQVKATGVTVAICSNHSAEVSVRSRARARACVCVKASPRGCSADRSLSCVVCVCVQWLDQIATKFGFYDVFKKDLVRPLSLSLCRRPASRSRWRVFALSAR
jgi:hypothetical protein